MKSFPDITKKNMIQTFVLVSAMFFQLVEGGGRAVQTVRIPKCPGIDGVLPHKASRVECVLRCTRLGKEAVYKEISGGMCYCLEKIDSCSIEDRIDNNNDDLEEVNSHNIDVMYLAPSKKSINNLHFFFL